VSVCVVLCNSQKKKKKINGGLDKFANNGGLADLTSVSIRKLIHPPTASM
jgi:hypothetical protein